LIINSTNHRTLFDLSSSPRSRRTSLVVAPAVLAWAVAAEAQTPNEPSAVSATPVSAPASAPATPAGPGLTLRSAPTLNPLPGGDAARQVPIILRARDLRVRPDLDTVAEGDAEFRRGALVIRADRLSYDQADDLAQARGNVRVSREGNVYSGPELQLHVQRFEGFFNRPSYFFDKTGAGGSAQRIDFLDEQRAVATGATYTSCPSDGSGGPAWLLSTGRVKMDFEANEGIAENAVLRFYGVPILAAPVLSFPLTDERKSGWLPPSINLDSKSGLQFSMPYYWNIAPQRDATITPFVSARRGLGTEVEFRYLEPRYEGVAAAHLMPNDRLSAGSSRYALNLQHEAGLPHDTHVGLRVLRVSDDDYWKDFPSAASSITPRLLASQLRIDRPLGGDWSGYVRAQRWQVLQVDDPSSLIEAPYERAPQIGARWLRRTDGGLQLAFEAEVNRFVNPSNGATGSRPTGARGHALGSVEQPFTGPGWALTPRLSFNAASYSLDPPLVDGRRSASRFIPTLSVDNAWVLERETNWFGRAVRQTLEPRILYVNTPYRSQVDLPNFDSAAKDFNFESIFTENSFSGVDRVADAHQITAGVTTRLLDPQTGAESLRLGVVQRYLLRDQRITPDGKPFAQRFSDVLLLGSTSVIPRWSLEGSVQYSPDIKRTVRSILGARYSPGPFRTVNATYRLARGLSEQVELGWQWPVYGATPERRSALSSAGTQCSGSWYSVGRINYSTRESRITDSIIGAEYDAGCWIGRVVAERLSTGRSEATTRLLLQLELVGLSRLGSNPLQVLKDNIPGYRLLREERGVPAATNAYE
jgi:LPS-assembly protein